MVSRRLEFPPRANTCINDMGGVRYQKPNLRNLYFVMIPACLGVEWTSGFDSSMMNGIQTIKYWDDCELVPGLTSARERLADAADDRLRSSGQGQAGVHVGFVFAGMYSGTPVCSDSKRQPRTANEHCPRIHHHDYRLCAPDGLPKLYVCRSRNTHMHILTGSGMCSRNVRDCPDHPRLRHPVRHRCRLVADWRAVVSQGASGADVAVQLVVVHRRHCRCWCELWHFRNAEYVVVENPLGAPMCSELSATHIHIVG